MHDASKTKAQLVSEVKGLRRRIADLEALETESEKAAKVLRESEKFFRTFMDNNPAVMYLKNIEGRHIYGNQTLFKYFNFTLDSFIGTTNHDIFPSEIANHLYEIDEIVRAEKKVVELKEWRDIRGDEERWWKEIKFPVQSNKGELLVGGIALNITELKQAKENYKEQLQFEKLISRISAKFINLPFEQIDGKIDDGLKLVAESLDIDRSLLHEFSENRQDLRLSHFFVRPGIQVPASIITSVEQPYFAKTILNNEIIRMERIDNLPKDAKLERKYLMEQGVKSGLAIPLIVGKEPVGALTFTTASRERSWPDEVVQRLQLISEVFANALGRKQKDQKLQNALSEIKELKDQLQQENIYLRQEIELQHKHGEIVGKSNTIKYVLSQAEQVAETDSTVLILGETGTGKELLARAIHNLSPRKGRPMIKVNCATLPATLIESELFGRGKGAYTGALSSQMGRFEMADGATIFLDEISEMPLELQAKLLRVLQEGEFERLGDPRTINVDVRVIASTNRNLAKSLEQGSFREDLYYRLNVFPITIPPLRERKEDIPLLVWTFAKQFNVSMGKKIDHIANKDMDALKRYQWPGNIRELKNIIERAMILCQDSALRINLPGQSESKASQTMILAEVEKRHIVNTLNSTNWRVGGKNGAADILGLKRTTLLTKMKKLKIRRPKD